MKKAKRIGEKRNTRKIENHGGQHKGPKLMNDKDPIISLFVHQSEKRDDAINEERHLYLIVQKYDQQNR